MAKNKNFKKLNLSKETLQSARGGFGAYFGYAGGVVAVQSRGGMICPGGGGNDGSGLYNGINLQPQLQFNAFGGVG
jgi:hypothetical protein